MVSGITLLNTSTSKWDRDNELCELLSLTSRIYLLIPVLTRILGSHLFLLPSTLGLAIFQETVSSPSSFSGK